MSEKNLVKARAGKLGASARWGPDGRIVRLDSLDPVTRAIVVAILRARKAAAEAAVTADAPPDRAA